MAFLRDHSLSSEKRLERRHPDKYPTMHEISPGVVASLAEEDDAFSQWLIDQQKAPNAHS